ncbi:MAG: YdcF family protein [Lentisphaerae bacterium]|nr:YdcF family protein [Lentisphaerota bacterium]
MAAGSLLNSGCDALVVMGKRPMPGRPPRELEARAAFAVLLWRASRARLPLICVEGHDIEGYAASGAEVVADVARRAGVPDNLLDAPALSNCTAREVEGVRDVLARRGCRRPLVVTHAYHARRTRGYFREVGIAAEICACSSRSAALATEGEGAGALLEVIRKGEPPALQVVHEHLVELILTVLHTVDRGGSFERWLSDRIRRGGVAA